VFHDTYKALYQSVPSDEEELNDMFNELREGVYRVCQNGECYSDHKIIVHDVIQAVKKLIISFMGVMNYMYLFHLFLMSCCIILMLEL
jgi:hypothetical protein